MKHYIMLSYIHGSGGVQCYVAAKAKYLEEQGWHVVVISSNLPNTKKLCLIPYLNKYIHNGIPYLGYHPHQLPRYFVNKTLSLMVDAIGGVEDADEFIVESWNCQSALWGELLASKIHGRHMFWTANEHYRGRGMCYEEKIRFFLFKMERGELFASVQTANRLFEGYRCYRDGDILECPIAEDPIQDVIVPEVDCIKKADWNICYIGRSIKPYVPNIYQGVMEFASRHKDKTIQLILLGEVEQPQRALVDSINVPNLKIVELGNLYPIPRILYSKIDVVIAGSGSARHSADAGALVITADPETKNSHGLLGYDTLESVYKHQDNNGKGLDLSFTDALDLTLVKQTWRHQTNKWVKSADIEACTKVQFHIISMAKKALEYYDEKELLQGRVNIKILCSLLYKNIFKYRLVKKYCI